MTAVIGHVEGHYEPHILSYGQAYIWCPECVVVGCDCGEMVILTASESVCRCGVDHEALVRETTVSRGPRHGTPLGPGVPGVVGRIPAFGETLSAGTGCH
jgi:hypothetical protein